MEKRVLNGNLPVIVEPMAASNTDNTYNNTNTNTNTNFNSGGFGERRQSLHHAQSNDEKSAVHGGSVVKGQLPPTPAPILSFKTPKNTLVYIVKVGMAKGAMSALNIFLLSFLSGLFVGYGALSVYIVYGGMDNGPGSLGALSPGFAKFIGACNFPVALMMIIFCGGELFTGNTMYLPAALMARKITVLQAAKSWFFSYFGNFAGCAVHAYFLTYLAQELTSDPWHTFIQHLTEKKIDLGWGVVFLKGIGANMLVCIAVFMAIASDSYSGKVAACFFPIICFFICGYEHCVANMYTILAGLFYGADRTFGQFIYRNLIPATLGNACGAFTFIACLYYVYNEDTREGLTKIELRQGKHRKNPTWRSFHFPGAHIFSHNPFRSGHPSGTASPTNGIIGGNLDSASTDLMLGNGGIGASRPYSTTTSSSHIARV